MTIFPDEQYGSTPRDKHVLDAPPLTWCYQENETCHGHMVSLTSSDTLQ